MRPVSRGLALVLPALAVLALGGGAARATTPASVPGPEVAAAAVGASARTAVGAPATIGFFRYAPLRTGPSADALDLPKSAVGLPVAGAPEGSVQLISNEGFAAREALAGL
ncbi:hypothetical protein ACN20G_19485 [Streptomyces sp. BI20]|uniref:hypothetical protein n=1 Tax=Streptomyces sp. BI20 TaxID=3403460 RepID=UPI003C74F478